jgi:hypothetical protein
MRLTASLALTLLLAACKGSESSTTPPGDPADVGADGAGDIGADAGASEAALEDAGGGDVAASETSTADGATGGDGATDASADATPPDFVEPATGNSDPFLGGAAATTGLTLGATGTVTIAGTIASAGGNPAWADSDAYAFTVGADTNVQAELTFPSPSASGGAVWSVAIHKADRKLVAWWGMSTEGRALTQPTKLPAGTYFVHVAAASPAPAAPIPYTVRLRAGALGDCVAGSGAAYLENEATVRGNDAVSVDWFAYPRLAATTATDPPESSGITLPAGASAVIEGSSGATKAAGDSYLDRDAFTFTAGPDTHEVRVLLEYMATDVNLDVFVFAADEKRLVGTGIEVSGSPERAAIPVEPGKTYWLWIGARDESAIGGDKTLPARYRATLCGLGGAK